MDNDTWMPASKFFKLVKEYFAYLFEEYGFSVVNEEISSYWDVCELVLQSKEWRLRIVREKGSLAFSVSPSSAPNRWFSLGDVITFLEPDSEDARAIWFGPKVNWAEAYVSRLHRQLQWYADKLHPYCSRIAHTFSDDIFKDKEGELKEWEKLREKRIKEAVAQGIFPDSS